MYTVRVRRLTRKQTTSKPDKLWPEIWKDMSDASKRKEKQNWAIENPKLDNGRKLRGIHIIDPDDGEFKYIIRNACRKLEVPMPAALPCKIQLGVDRHTYRAPHFPMHSCCAASLCCLSWNNSHPHRHISCLTCNVHGLTAFLFCFFLCTGVSPAISNVAFSFAVLPNTAPL